MSFPKQGTNEKFYFRSHGHAAMIPRTPAAALHGNMSFPRKQNIEKDDSSCAEWRVGMKTKRREAIALHEIEHNPPNIFLWTRPTLEQLKSHREDDLPKTWNK
ncbi:hypothetical protein CDAR_105861 [Caerostris darwini]|uniref:Uncharacterized protein n=1 Tax=Caerostris darwini TaxID=1538125 RepID=A0AAV4TQN0_9ARAC|nr:hypothetical protein CDAR_105861 [Caerostris darwini]